MEQIKKVITIRKNGTKRVQHFNEHPSKTDQQFIDDCDVNTIVRKYKNPRDWPLSKKQGVYADVSNLPDLQKASELVKEAESTFNQLPADIRFKFRNNPAEMIDYLRDPQNHSEARKLGLLKPLPPQPQNDDLNDEPPKPAKKSQKIPKPSETEPQE